MESLMEGYQRSVAMNGPVRRPEPRHGYRIRTITSEQVAKILEELAGNEAKKNERTTETARISRCRTEPKYHESRKITV
jgi:hypothetical protein